MEVENKPLREGRNWRTEKTFQIHITASSSCCGGPTGVRCCRYRSVPVPRAEKSLLFRWRDVQEEHNLHEARRTRIPEEAEGTGRLQGGPHSRHESRLVLGAPSQSNACVHSARSRAPPRTWTARTSGPPSWSWTKATSPPRRPPPRSKGCKGVSAYLYVGLRPIRHRTPSREQAALEVISAGFGRFRRSSLGAKAKKRQSSRFERGSGARPRGIRPRAPGGVSSVWSGRRSTTIFTHVAPTRQRRTYAAALSRDRDGFFLNTWPF